MSASLQRSNHVNKVATVSYLYFKFLSVKNLPPNEWCVRSKFQATTAQTQFASPQRICEIAVPLIYTAKHHEQLKGSVTLATGNFIKINLSQTHRLLVHTKPSVESRAAVQTEVASGEGLVTHNNTYT
jgi:hypothetical protein